MHRRYCGIVVAMLLIFATGAHAQNPPQQDLELSLAAVRLIASASLSPGGLAGVKKVGVLVEGLRGNVPERTGVTRERLETSLKAALIRSRTVGIDEAKIPSVQIYLNINILPLSTRSSSVYALSIELTQGTYIWRDGRALFVLATTWDDGCVGIAPDADLADVLRRAIEESVDKFAVDWKRENP